jgi:tight adherence protein C
MAKTSSTKQEIAEIAVVLGVALRGDATLQAALAKALENASGGIATRLKLALSAIELGLPVDMALAKAIEGEPDAALEEFIGKLQLSNQIGSALSDQLDHFAKTLFDQLAREKLARATAAETKMLIPLVFLILPVTVVFALYPSFQILNLQMEGMQ